MISPVDDATTNVASSLIDALIASSRGDRHAFAYGEKRYSYQDVAALMNRAGNMLKAMNVQAGAHVLILVPSSPAFVATLLGAMKFGAVPVVVNGEVGATGLMECVAAVKPAVVVIHQNFLASLSGALAGLPAKSIIVVGADDGSHTSFVEAIRSQASWLSAEPVDGNAVALGWWTAPTERTLSHAQLATMLEGDGGDEAIEPTLTILRDFAKGETTNLARG